MNFEGLWYDCEGVDSSTSDEQCTCEKTCAPMLQPFSFLKKDVLKSLRNIGLVNEDDETCLLRDMHVSYLT